MTKIKTFATIVATAAALLVAAPAVGADSVSDAIAKSVELGSATDIVPAACVWVDGMKICF